MSACDCTERDRYIQDLPLSSACASGICGGCDGFTDGYSTYHCGHRCHWCPSGLHLRREEPAP